MSKEYTPKFLGKDPYAVLKTMGMPIGGYVPTEQERKRTGYILNRFQEMFSKRSVVHRQWQTFIQQLESIFVPYTDGRSRSNYPVERCMIELFVAESLKRPTTWTVKEENMNFQDQARVFKHVWDYDFSGNERNKTFILDDFICSTIGTSIIGTGYEYNIHEYSDLNLESMALGNPTFTKKTSISGNVFIRNIDIRRFFVDDKAIDMDDAEDCIMFEYVPYLTFLSYQNNPLYKNIKYVRPGKMKDGDIRVFMTKEERNNASTEYVELMRYYNVATDEYVVVANGQVEILHMPLISYDGKKSSKWGGKTLPFTSRQYMRNIYGFYGMGIPEIVLQFKSKLNILEEMLMDAIKRSSNTVFAIGNNLQFDGNGFALNNQILKFDGDLNANNFQQITGTPPNNAIFSHRDNVFRDLAVVSGIDIRNELDNTQTTAYQTAVEKEAQQKRLNLVFSNKDISYQRIANQHRCNLQMFFPQKMVREMTDSGDTPVETYPTIPMNGELRKKGKLIKKAGTHLFEVRPEDIMGDIGIEVYTDVNTTAINEVEKAQKLEFFSALQGITALYAQNPSLENIISQNTSIKDLAENFHVETKSSDQQGTEKAISDTYDKLHSIAQQFQPSDGGQGMAPVPQGSPQAQGALPATPNSPAQATAPQQGTQAITNA